jgi:putative FmdB family regulatory protein
MLTYENRCTECGHVFESEQKITDETRPECPLCGAPSTRQLQPAPFRLLGDCWGDTG